MAKIRLVEVVEAVELEVNMTEAILTVGIFAVPILAVAVIEQRKRELKRRKRIREMEQFKNGMAYRDECMKQSVLNTERQQVDKEEKRYARVAD